MISLESDNSTSLQIGYRLYLRHSNAFIISIESHVQQNRLSSHTPELDPSSSHSREHGTVNNKLHKTNNVQIKIMSMSNFDQLDPCNYSRNPVL